MRVTGNVDVGADVLEHGAMREGEVPCSRSAWNWLTSLARQIAMPLWHGSLHLIVLALWLLPPFWNGKHYFPWAKRIWAPGLFWIGGARPRFVGRDGVDWSQPHVIVANHQGNADIPLLFALVPGPLMFVAKRSVGRIPLLGWMLRLAGFPLVDRYNPAKGRQSLDDVADRIRNEKLNVAIFSEGTRSPEGTMLPFKKGAFLLAIKAQVPILPVAIEGSGTVMARRSWRIYPGPLVATVGEPIPTVGLTEKDRDDVLQRTEAEILRILGWRKIQHGDLPAARKADRVRRYRTLASVSRDVT
jgi:1-acyl-sn-glycerol-3-phosphate acyltransferase